jgi:hypothetical protein
VTSTHQADPSSTTTQSAPSHIAVMRAGVWPTISALVIAAIMIIERLQVDWTASCSLVTNTPQSCGLKFYESLFSLLLPSFAFALALAHFVGAASLYADGGSRRALWERVGKFTAFFAIHLFPAFGGHLFYVGLAAGFLISLTVVGLIVAPIVGVMAAGFVSGSMLALAAGPTVRSLDGAGWKRLIWFYGCASAMGPNALFGVPLHEWLIRDADPKVQEKIYIIAASGGEPYALYCLRSLPDSEHCTIAPDLPVPLGTTQKTRNVAYKEGDRYEFKDLFGVRLTLHLLRFKKGQRGKDRRAISPPFLPLQSRLGDEGRILRALGHTVEQNFRPMLIFFVMAASCRARGA